MVTCVESGVRATVVFGSSRKARLALNHSTSSKIPSSEIVTETFIVLMAESNVYSLLSPL